MTYSVWTLNLSALCAFTLCTVGCGDSSDGSGGSGGNASGSCVEAAPDALRACIGEFSTAIASCYSSTDAPCASDDANTAAALAALRSTVEGSCEDGEFGSLSVAALVGRLRNSCSSEASSTAWRTYGGPQGSVWPEAGTEQSCLASAHQAGASLIDGSLSAINACLAGGDCDAAALASDREALATTALGEIESACGALEEIVAVTPQIYVDRAAHQVDCITATGQADTGSLQLSCGPSNVDFEATRGEFMQVVVDGGKWGTLCGDGTDYAFLVRLAPEGEPLDRIVIGLEGGGVCAFEADCSSRFESSPQLFNALDNTEAIVGGIGSNDPEESPFAAWTKVFLPYCNQDVFAGGGVMEELGEITVPRYGAVNLRAATQMVRDVIWKMMDEDGGDGFRPDELVAFFGGWSAGGYGTLYNYHWLLDDLQWPRTIAFPDAGGALDNGEVLGVRGLGLLKIPGWGALPNLPPYCFEADCAVGPFLYEAISPRLKQVPEQQMLITSNQKDTIQQGDMFFEDEAVWMNAMRANYCDSKELEGIHFYFTTISDESVHVVTIRQELWEDEVDGAVMSDWFLQAVTDPDSIESHAEEGDFVEVVEGVNPFPCEVGE